MINNSVIVVLLLMLFASCSGVNGIFNGEIEQSTQCFDKICIEIKPSSISGDSENSIELMLRFHLNTDSSFQNQSLTSILSDTKYSEFNFNLYKYVYLIKDSDTIPAQFSHLENNAGVSNDLTQFVGFDASIKDKRDFKLLIKESFFSNHLFLFEL
jgi:hypothetical protein